MEIDNEGRITWLPTAEQIGEHEIRLEVNGRITAVIDPSGERIEYEYDSDGNLITVIDREDNETKFTYNSDRPHYLDSIIDPLGREGIRNEYDDKGRLVKSIDASGNAIELIHDPDNFIHTVKDQLVRSPVGWVECDLL